MRRSLIAAPVAILAGITLAGCTVRMTTETSDASPTISALPACDGAATSEHGLGNAIRDSIAVLSALPPRFSTGAGTVTESDGRLIVTMRLCGPGASADQTRDAASAVSRSIGRSAELGPKVSAVHVENPDAAIRIVTSPFDAVRFAANVPLTDLRSEWRIDETAR